MGTQDSFLMTCLSSDGPSCWSVSTELLPLPLGFPSLLLVGVLGSRCLWLTSITPGVSIRQHGPGKVMQVPQGALPLLHATTTPSL